MGQSEIHFRAEMQKRDSPKGKYQQLTTHEEAMIQV